MKKEVIINLILTVLTSIMSFFQNKYFIHYMGIETLGIMKLFNQLLQYLSIVEMGVGSASAFALYKPLAERNYRQVSIVLSTIKSFYNKVALVIFLLGVLVMPTLQFFIKLEKFDKIIYVYWTFYLLNTVSTYLFIKYIILFTANQEIILVRYIQSFTKICFQIIQIMCIIKFNNFLLYIILLMLDNLTQFIFFKLHYKRKYKSLYKTKERYRELTRDIKNLFWHRVAWLIVLNTDLILISKFSSIEIVGIYASYQMVLQIIVTLIGVITAVIKPKIGKFISINSVEYIYILFKEINVIFLYLSFFCAYCTFILINSFIENWIGKEYVLEKITVLLITINLFIVIFRGILENFKEASGFFDDIQSPILEAIINLIFSLWLGKRYGLNGIITGTIISNIVVILIYKPILVFKRCFDKEVSEYIRVYGNYVLVIMINIFILCKVVPLVEKNQINTWMEWIKYSVIVSSIIFLVTSLVFLINKDFRIVIRKYILKK